MEVSLLIGWGIKIAIGLGVLVLALVFLKLVYVKASPDEAIIISGLKRRYVIGKGTIVIPFLERKDRLDLKMMNIDLRTSSFVPTVDYINIEADGAVKVQIGTTHEMLERAAKNFLNKDERYIVDAVKDVLEGNLREIIGTTSLQAMVTDRKSFSEKVQENAVPDLEKMGLIIIAFNIQNFKDEKEVLVDLGIDNISKIKKEASIAKAKADKEVAIEEAKAESEANAERVKADTEIAERLNQLEIRKSELQISANTERAKADMTYDIQKEQMRRELENATATAENLKAERQIEIRENQLNSEIKKQADAELYRRVKEAEAEKAEAEAEAAAMRAKAEAEATGIRAKNLAEAEGIRAKALAEAEGIEKKAEAMSKFGEAAVFEMYANAIARIADAVAKPLGTIDRVTMYGDGNGTKMISDIVGIVSKLDESLQQSLGIDIKEYLSNPKNK
jgi:flotillin